MSEGLAQGPYMAARMGFEPAALWTEGAVPTSHHAPQSLPLWLYLILHM